MSAVLMDAAIVSRAQYILGQAPATPKPRFKLFVNNHTPACDDSPGMYTECTLAGYASLLLNPASWSCSLSSCVETCTYPTITETFTAGGQTIYGHFVIDDLTGNLLWAELWPTPFAVPSGGGSIQIVLQWVDQQCP